MVTEASHRSHKSKPLVLLMYYSQYVRWPSVKSSLEVEHHFLGAWIFPMMGHYGAGCLEEQTEQHRVCAGSKVRPPSVRVLVLLYDVFLPDPFLSILIACLLGWPLVKTIRTLVIAMQRPWSVAL
jgi:hypothetical protein